MSAVDQPINYVHWMGRELDLYALKQHQGSITAWDGLITAVQENRWTDIPSLLAQAEATIYHNKRIHPMSYQIGQYKELRTSFLSGVENAKQYELMYGRPYYASSATASVSQPSPRHENSNTDTSSLLSGIVKDLVACIPQSDAAQKLHGKTIESDRLMSVIKYLIAEIQTEVTKLKSSESQSQVNLKAHEADCNILRKWVGWFVESMKKGSRDREPNEHQGLMQETNQCIKDLNDIFEAHTRKMRENATNKEAVAKIQDQMKQLDFLADENRKLQRKMESMEEALKKAETDKQYWINRVSKVAGTKLTTNNPGITDLSDPNRPGKIAERYGELYDNHWTEAMETLERVKGKIAEHENIKTLATLLKGCFEICEEFSKKQKKELKAVLFTVDEHHVDDEDEKGERLVSKSLSDCRKEAGSNVLPALQQIVLKRTQQFLPEEVKLIPNYIVGCVDVCWAMVLQEPNLCFFWPTTGEREEVNSDFFTPYTRSGKGIELVVWPAMFLHKKGPLLRKGTFQPFTKQAWQTQSSSYA